MRKSTKIVAGCSVAGFLLPIPLLIFKANAMLVIYLCPPAIVALAFAIDGPRWLADSGLLWAAMCMANSVLYAALAFVIVRIYRVVRPDAQAGSQSLQ
jgi:hypothetical protein